MLTENPPDKTLLLQIKEDDSLAFDLLFERYWEKLYRAANARLNDDAVAQDIVQEIFISLWNNAENATILNLEAYLFRAAKYKIANHIRNLKFTKEHLDILDGIATPGKSVNDIEYVEFEKGIMQHVERLSPKCREVFTLSRFEHLSNSEIAARLGLSKLTVEKHISNALKELRSHLSSWQYHVIVVLMFL